MTALEKISNSTLAAVLAVAAFGVFMIWHYRREMDELKNKKYP